MGAARDGLCPLADTPRRECAASQASRRADRGQEDQAGLPTVRLSRLVSPQDQGPVYMTEAVTAYFGLNEKKCEQRIMLVHKFNWPTIPPLSTSHHASDRMDRWQRQALMLWLIAQGFALRIEIQKIVSTHLGINFRSGALRQIIPDLENNGLVITKKLALPGISRRGQLKMVCVHLSLEGKDLARDFGWTVSESELERMQRLHEKGKSEDAHTAAALAFSFQARLRGWKAGVMPEVGHTHFAPDVQVVKGSQQVFVEVELSRKAKTAKWRNMADYQGVIALCARDPGHREILMGDAESVIGGKIIILGTDLRSLFENVKNKPLGPLWFAQW